MERVTTRVECGEYFEARDEALKAHATQIDPTSRWFAVPLEIQREMWPTEEYELVRSLVDSHVARRRPVRRGIKEKVNTESRAAGTAWRPVASSPCCRENGDGDKGGQGEDFGKSSPVGLLMLILFLSRSSSWSAR